MKSVRRIPLTPETIVRILCLGCEVGFELPLARAVESFGKTGCPICQRESAAIGYLKAILEAVSALEVPGCPVKVSVVG